MYPSGTLDTTNADAVLSNLASGTPAGQGIQACGIVSSTVGFCECKSPWYAPAAATGLCLSPCYSSGDDTTGTGVDECYPGADITATTGQEAALWTA